MRLSKKQLINIIKEHLLVEGHELIPNSEVISKIDKVLGSNVTNINSLGIAGFSDLMKEIAIVETGYVIDKKRVHANEKLGKIKGVFQLSPIALKQLRKPSVVPSTQLNWYKKQAETYAKKSAMDFKPFFKELNDEEIYADFELQAIAACMYALYLYYNVAGEPDISSVDARASFWSNYYNSKKDKDGTTELYHKKLEEFNKSLK